MEFCSEARRESREVSFNLCSWCSYNWWVGPETERIPQPVPDPNNPGHFMDVYQTKLTGRTPDDYLPRKCLKDLYEEHSDSIINSPRAMLKNVASLFCFRWYCSFGRKTVKFAFRKKSRKSSGGTKLVEKRRKRLIEERNEDGEIGSLASWKKRPW